MRRILLAILVGAVAAGGMSLARHGEHGKGSYVRPRPRVRRLGSDPFARRRRDAGKAAFVAEVESAGSRPSLIRSSVDQNTVTKERPPSDIAGRLGLTGRAKVIVRRPVPDRWPAGGAGDVVYPRGARAGDCHR